MAAIEPRPDDTFVEIGPGRGAVTLPLAGLVARVIAVEIDRDLAAGLASRAPANCSILEGDVLEIDLAAAVATHRVGPADAGALRIVGNLPYNISSPILRRLVELYGAGLPVRDATLMLQREVADRLLAAPGSRDYGRLTILVRLHADVVPLLSLPPGAFRPPPAVQSSVVRLTFHPPAVPIADPGAFDRFVRELFAHRRKTLAAILRPLAAARGLDAAGILASAGLDSRRRPETLDLAELARLAEVFTSTPPGAVL